MDPTISNFAYGEDSPSQTLDLYQAEGHGPHPLYIHIHGGGFRQGDKANLRENLVRWNREAGVSVASLNYRLSGEAKAPAAMLDCARAVQTLRYHAQEWNLDPEKFAAGGPSAGAGISLWLAFHADFADPASGEPVQRCSSRLCAVVPNDAQTSYDPRFIRDHISPRAVDSVGLLGYYGVTPDDLREDELGALYEECSPLTHLQHDAPPVFLWYWTFDVPRDETLSTRDGIHHPEFGRILQKRMQALGLRCELHYREEAPEPADSDAVIAHYDRLSLRFVHEVFGVESDATTQTKVPSADSTAPLE